MLTAFNFFAFLKISNNDFQQYVHSIFQYIAKIRSKCKETKKNSIQSRVHPFPYPPAGETGSGITPPPLPAEGQSQELLLHLRGEARELY